MEHKYTNLTSLPAREQVFLRNAENIATLSHDSQVKHGTVITVKDNVVATGYNGFPAGADDANLPTTRPDKYPYIVHSETNAICNAARRGVSIDGGTLYCTGKPCLECLKQLLQCGIRRFVIGNRGHSKSDEQDKFVEYYLRWYNCEVVHVIDFPESVQSWESRYRLNNWSDLQSDLYIDGKLIGKIKSGDITMGRSEDRKFNEVRHTYEVGSSKLTLVSRIPVSEPSKTIVLDSLGEYVGDAVFTDDSKVISFNCQVEPVISATIPTPPARARVISRGNSIATDLLQLRNGSTFLFGSKHLPTPFEYKKLSDNSYVRLNSVSDSPFPDTLAHFESSAATSWIEYYRSDLE